MAQRGWQVRRVSRQAYSCKALDGVSNKLNEFFGRFHTHMKTMTQDLPEKFAWV